MSAYYNEFDPGAAAWLRELIKEGHIADGEVDTRSILDVRHTELLGFTQVHLFAGIGGWSHALRLAGWPDDRPCWTGSAPCQPFSAAGRQEGRDDARHLAPHFISLVGAARPAVLFGEQVASAEVFGTAASSARKRVAEPPAWAWIDDLSDRLEAARYAVGASDFPSAGVGAPHIRQRTFFGAVRMADSDGAGLEGQRDDPASRRTWDGVLHARAGREPGGLADADGRNTGAERQQCGGPQRQQPQDGGDGELGAAGPWKSYADWFGVCWHAECRNSDRGFCDCHTRSAPDGWAWDIHDGWLADADRGERQRDRSQARRIESDSQPAAGCQLHDTSPLHGFWADADWLFCRDGKWRPVEPAVLRVVDGLPGCVVPSGSFVPASYPLAQGGKDARRVMRLRGYGNAINPHAAALFIQAFDAATAGLVA